MNSSLLIVVPFCSADGALAEKLIDWLYLLNFRQQKGHCLLVASSNAHEELRQKVKLSAEITFESVTLVAAKDEAAKNRGEHIGSVLRTAAKTVFEGYRCPWFWLEPDCVPFGEDWHQKLAMAYTQQPRRYFGSLVNFNLEHKPHTALMRCAVYPADAWRELRQLPEEKTNFIHFSATVLYPLSARCRLIQQHSYTHDPDPSKLRPDTVLFHSDKTGGYLSGQRDIWETKLAAYPTLQQPSARRRGRPPKVQSLTPAVA